MLRKVVLGSVGVATLIPVVGAATPIKEDSPDPSKPPLMKPSELPIYEAPHAEYAEKVKLKADENNIGYIKLMLLPPVQAVREQVQIVVDHTERVKHTVQEQYQDIQDKTGWIFQYLREEENKEIRYGAVAMGGLTGLIFGLRGGLIRRVFYATTGTTAMGYICFPEETKDILKNNSSLAKQYVNIAYNFLYGDHKPKEKEAVDDQPVPGP